jgi:hypothetical protein
LENTEEETIKTEKYSVGYYFEEGLKILPGGRMNSLGNSVHEYLPFIIPSAAKMSFL